MSETAPRPLGPARIHYWTVVAMARVTGTDLAAAFADGRLTPPDWARAVEACRGCGWARGCKGWMGDADEASLPVPRACPNAEMFDRLLET
ncbi:hypothetical protein HKCCE3408_02230 [Rhodobacterales bacterium HKCCE3408]|nr:hypothetical protein [Rhodobacterales bacterium HKCCE3408]